jgi:hypothetical protein
MPVQQAPVNNYTSSSLKRDGLSDCGQTDAPRERYPL